MDRGVLLNKRESDLRDFFYEKNSIAFDRVFKDGIKGICSNLIELTVILLAATGLIDIRFIIPVVVYNFYTGIKALLDIGKLRLVLTQITGHPDMFGELLLDLSSSIVAGRSSRLMHATVYMHMILIVLISLYFHIVPGIILAALFYYMVVQMERVYLRVMEYYKA